MRTQIVTTSIFIAALSLPALSSAQQFTFSGRGHTYKVTVSSLSSSGLGFAGHGIYDPTAILPSSLTGGKYVLLFTANTNAYPSGWPVAESIFMQTSTDGVNWGTPTAIISKASNICDMAGARAFYDGSASLWRVFVQAVTYSGSGCSPDGQIFEATGSTLSSLSWYSSGGSAISISGDVGNPGIGEYEQWFNTTNYDGPSGLPFLLAYNDWSFTGVNSSYCPTCVNNGTPMFAYLTPDAESTFYYWYYTSPSFATADTSGSGATNLLLYPDVLLGGTADQSTLGAPGFSFGNDCTTGSGQFGRGVAFYPTPVPNNTSSPSLPGQFMDGTFTSSVTGLIVIARLARNQYGFLDKTGSSPNTWQTLVFYNAADESNGTICPSPSIQSTWLNNGSSGNPTSAWGVSQVTITEQ